MTTPVTTWATAFHAAGFRWLSTMPMAMVFSDQPFANGHWRCRLCERCDVQYSERDDHRLKHLDEYRAWIADFKRKEREERMVA